MTILAFYHPWLLGFDLVPLALIGMMLLVWDAGLSAPVSRNRGRSMRRWPGSRMVSRCPLTFRNRESLQFCVDQANTLTGSYLMARENHFRIVFRQFGFALLTQALASTVLLGLGGWLVISGQLTLGQLVAAELIVTVILGSFAKLGKQLESFLRPADGGRQGQHHSLLAGGIGARRNPARGDDEFEFRRDDPQGRGTFPNFLPCSAQRRTPTGEMILIEGDRDRESRCSSE